MPRFSMILVCSCVGFFVGACSGDDEDDGGGGGSGANVICQVEDDMGEVIGCNEHEIPASAVEQAREACTNDDGGSLVDECPAAGRLGDCSLSNGALVMNFYEAAGDAVDAEELCTGLGGDWNPA
jgi:hypothetical protein